MSDTKQLKPGDDGVPVLVYGQIEDTDYVPSIDTSDAYRVKLISWEDLAKTVLAGKTIGGTGTSDIADNSTKQTFRNKTLINPIITLTNDGQEDVVALYKISVLINALIDAEIEDGEKLVEVAGNIPRQSFCAVLNKASDGSRLIALTAEEIFAASGIDGTLRKIDARSLIVSAWTLNAGELTQKYDWTAKAAVAGDNVTLTTLKLTMNDASTTYNISVHFRFVEE